MSSPVVEEDAVDTWLAHFGVKGMRWGKRKARDDSSGDASSAPPAKPKKLTGKEVRAEKREFYQKKADNLLKKATEDPESLIAVRTPGDYATTIATGREFMDYMARGGMMDIRLSDVYATKDKSGNYVVNENMNQKFVRSDKKKK